MWPGSSLHSISWRRLSTAGGSGGTGRWLGRHRTCPPSSLSLLPSRGGGGGLPPTSWGRGEVPALPPPPPLQRRRGSSGRWTVDVRWGRAGAGAGPARHSPSSRAESASPSSSRGPGRGRTMGSRVLPALFSPSRGAGGRGRAPSSSSVPPACSGTPGRPGCCPETPCWGPVPAGDGTASGGEGGGREGAGGSGCGAGRGPVRPTTSTEHSAARRCPGSWRGPGSHARPRPCPRGSRSRAQRRAAAEARPLTDQVRRATVRGGRAGLSAKGTPPQA